MEPFYFRWVDFRLDRCQSGHSSSCPRAAFCVIVLLACFDGFVGVYHVCQRVRGIWSYLYVSRYAFFISSGTWCQFSRTVADGTPPLDSAACVLVVSLAHQPDRSPEKARIHMAYIYFPGPSILPNDFHLEVLVTEFKGRTNRQLVYVCHHGPLDRDCQILRFVSEAKNFLKVHLVFFVAKHALDLCDRWVDGLAIAINVSFRVVVFYHFIAVVEEMANILLRVVRHRFAFAHTLWR